MTKNDPFQVFKGGWDQLQNAVFTDNQTTVTAKSSFIKPDGTKLFVLNGTNVETYPLSIPWDVDTRGSLEATFDVSNEDSTPTGLFFQDDGSKMFVVGQVTNTMYGYTLPTSWITDSIISTPVELLLDGITVGDASQCAFSTGGSFAYVTDDLDVTSYEFDTAWDITSNTTGFNIFVFASDTDSVAFKAQGDKMYIGTISPPKITEFDLPTSFDISDTPQPTGNVLDLSSLGIIPTDLLFRGNGTELFVTSETTSNITKLHLDTDWNISTASHFENLLDTSSLATPLTQPRAIQWSLDGLIMFLLDSGQDSVSAFSVDNPFNPTSSLSLIGTPLDLSAQETTAQGMKWSNDGMSLFIIGTALDTVQEFTTNLRYSVDPANMSIIPASEFELQLGAVTPTGITFSRDELKMYISFSSPNNVFQWNLTGKHVLPANGTVKDKEITSLADTIRDLVIKPDGTQLFCVSNSPNDEIVRFTFGTPLEIDTIVVVDRFDVSTQTSNPQGLFMRQHDGKQLFVSGISPGVVASYDMSLEFNNNIITAFGEDLVTNTGENIVYA